MIKYNNLLQIMAQIRLNVLEYSADICVSCIYSIHDATHCQQQLKHHQTLNQVFKILSLTHTRSLTTTTTDIQTSQHNTGYCSGALTCFPNRCAKIVQQILHGALLARFADRLNEFLQIGAVLPGEWSSVHKCASELELDR